VRLTPPFVLLDDARAEGAVAARLYTDPVEIVTTRRPGEVAAALDVLRTATRGGLQAAGYLAYDAGAALEPKLAANAANSSAPLLWFGLFRSYHAIAPDDVASLLPDPAGGWLGTPMPGISRESYERRLAEVKALIEAGDIYQANLTFPAIVATQGHPLALYAGLRTRAASPYGGVVATGQQWILSLSPELFFALHDGKVTTRPMKGTAAPGSDPRLLREDPKQRAENLMIVDLLRNDLSRVAATGSVAVPELFRVEDYPTVQQMTSTVTAQLAEGRDAIDVVTALFPCGSITGAPKIRAMAAIAAIEQRARGVYTGSIGRIDPDGIAAFNVAIRTLVLDHGSTSAALSLGSGIVADSVAASEWHECLAKGVFVPSARRFDLIETMRFDPDQGLLRLDLHLERMKRSADAFGFVCDRHAARNELQAATFRLRSASRVRLLLGRSGRMAVEVRDAPAEPAVPVEVALAPLPVDADDWRLHHKTSDRRFWDRPGDTFETVYFNESGHVTEGSFTSIFVERDGVLLTPPADAGLLPGVLRASLIAEGRAREAVLTADDLHDGFLIGNSLRGLLPARLAGV